MTSMLLERRALRRDIDASTADDPRLFESDRASGEQTLDDIVSGTWEGLAARAAATCVVCGGELRPRETAAGPPAGGRCVSCGSTLE